MKLLNETDEDIVIKAGESLNLSFDGEYEVEKTTKRTLAKTEKVYKILKQSNEA